LLSVRALSQSRPPVAVVAKVSGIVTDNAGAYLPGVTVTFKAKKIKRTIVAAKDGRYELELPAETYEVIGSLQGCKDFRLKGWIAKTDTANVLNMSLYCRPTPIY
jgi:hypothetical protein